MGIPSIESWVNQLENAFHTENTKINIDLTLSEAVSILSCMGQRTGVDEEDEKLCSFTEEKIYDAILNVFDKIQLDMVDQYGLNNLFEEIIETLLPYLDFEDKKDV